MYDVVCFSHLRWHFVFQRPQHLLSRCARNHRTIFVEEPTFAEGESRIEACLTKEGVELWCPRIDSNRVDDAAAEQERLLVDAFERNSVESPLLWYYTPMALRFTRSLPARARIYDCMDELSAFKGAPPELRQLEQELLAKADLVFTGGHSLFEAKATQHPSVHCFPSSVDFAHFAQARTNTMEPEDQAAVPRPRLGFYGVLDERLDLELVASVAAARRTWHFVFLGPVVKIDPAELPRAENIHYLGAKPYAELPAYLAGWDVALLPFARNESTRFISPTKTPEYLAAGKPVVSTPIRDVVTPYARQGLVRIAESAPAFVAACEAALKETDGSNRERADAFLAGSSWDRTWSDMERLLDGAMIRASGIAPIGAPLNTPRERVRSAVGG
jgi:UDP-galactopyranose mutase